MTNNSDVPSGAAISAISVVIPARNDEYSIAHVAQALCEAFDTLVLNYEIIIVDDGSVDATSRCAEEFAAGHVGVRVLRHDTHQGYGTVWRTGIAAATKPYVVLMDVDPLKVPPRELARVACWGASYDLVVAYCRDSSYRSVAGWCLATVVQALFGMRRWDIARGFVLGRTAYRV